MYAQDAKRRMEEKGLWCGHPPWGVISSFLTLSLFLASARTLKQKSLLKRKLEGPAVSIMTVSLDSHIVYRGLSPDPGSLKLMLVVCTCVPKVLRGEWRRKDCGVAILLGRLFLTFSLPVSLCLSS